jgi:mono/diheme cytochrome c family protein
VVTDTSSTAGATEFKRGQRVSSHGLGAVLTMGLTMMVATSGFFNLAPAAMARDLSEGQRIWAGKAGCAECHGWAGDGIGGADRNAPSLRGT